MNPFLSYDNFVYKNKLHLIDGVQFLRKVYKIIVKFWKILCITNELSRLILVFNYAMEISMIQYVLKCCPAEKNFFLCVFTF